MKRSLFVVLVSSILSQLLLPAGAHAGGADCEALSARMTDEQAYVRPPQALRVAGTERLHFHTAPDGGCVTRVFVIPEDVLIAYAAWKNWLFVQYTNQRSGKISSGWIDERRVQLTGSVGMDSGDAEAASSEPPAADAVSLPADVRAMVERLGLCTHFAGEFNGDRSERDREVNATMTELRCDSADAQAAVVRRRYESDPAVQDALDQAIEP